MGAGSSINDCPNIAEAWFAGCVHEDMLAALRGTFLLDTSMWVHEPMHVYGLITKQSLHAIPWFDDYFSEQTFMASGFATTVTVIYCVWNLMPRSNLLLRSL